MEVVERMPLDHLPERYREPMRDYLGQGVLPEAPLRLLLEGNVAAIPLFRDDRAGLFAVADWLAEHLTACSWGSRDQVQLWCVYVRRARGRAMLALMEST